MINELLLSEFDAEVKSTRAMLERVPIKPDFKPHPKSMALGKLAPHVAELGAILQSHLDAVQRGESRRSIA